LESQFGLKSGLSVSNLLSATPVKSVVFGVVMSLASCHYGLAVKGGAPGVGRGVNATVVTTYSFSFVTAAPPANGNAVLHVATAGSPASYEVQTLVPSTSVH